jgi:hypothetical protein
MIIGIAVLTGAPADTRPTMMEVDVEEDWTRTVTSTPIIKPTIGFFRSSESENKEPMFLPPRIRKESERKEREQMKKKRQARREISFVTVTAASFNTLGFTGNFILTRVY